MKFAAVNLGCKVNHVELEALAAKLVAAGFSFSGQADADYIFINTCTVTGEAERKTRKAVNRALAANDEAQVVITGCSVAIDSKSFLELSSRVRVVLRPDMDTFLQELMDGALAGKRETTGQIDDKAAVQDTNSFLSCQHEATLVASDSSDQDIASGLFRTRSGVKIQDGCDNACTYCIVHVARGASRSIPRSEVLQQVEQLVSTGTSEVVLTGINLGTYADEQGGLASLLEDCLALAGSLAPERQVRFRVSSIEPMDIHDDLIELMARLQGRVCRHLHIPLQAGSSKILQEMDRHYDAEEYLALIKRLRAAVPEISISTDVIVGFPGETEADFQETLALCKEAGFSKIHVFPYSMRQGTPAALRTDQIAPEIKQARAAVLRKLSDELRKEDYLKRVGSQELVLVEAQGFGMTESYHRVSVPDGAKTGTLLPLVLPVLQ